MALRRKDNFELEQGWDNKVNLQPLTLKSINSRQPVVHCNDRANSIHLNQLSNLKLSPATHGDPGNEVDDRETTKHNNQGPISSSALSSIITTLGFIHHEGTDQEKELDVVNCILLRESIILKLKNLCSQISHHNTAQFSDDSESELLNTLTLMRSTTTNYIECICTWRESDAMLGQHNLRKFLWEGTNYTLKITRDLDFLADQPLLISALKLPAEKIKANPLMLPNNLEEADTWMKPKQRAINDSGGLSEGIFFEERLRVRNAERVLLMELEIYSNVQTPEWDTDCNDRSKGGETTIDSHTINADRDRDKEQKNNNNNNDGPSSLALNALRQLKASTKISSSGGTGSNIQLSSSINPNSPKVFNPSSSSTGQSEVLLVPLLVGLRGSGSGVGGKRTAGERDFASLVGKKGPRTKGRNSDRSLSSLTPSSPFGSLSQPIPIRQNKTLKSLSTDSGGGSGSLRRLGGSTRSPGDRSKEGTEGFSVGKDSDSVVLLTADDVERVALMQTLPPRLVLATAAVVLLIGMHGDNNKVGYSCHAYNALYRVREGEREREREKVGERQRECEGGRGR
jgi:hypothetical protein